MNAGQRSTIKDECATALSRFLQRIEALEDGSRKRNQNVYSKTDSPIPDLRTLVRSYSLSDC